MIANRGIGWVCVAAVLLTACVPAVAWNRQTPASGDRAIVFAGPSAPTTPAVLDVLDPVIPSPQQVETPPGYVHWLLSWDNARLSRSAFISSGRYFVAASDSLQRLHCLLTI